MAKEIDESLPLQIKIEVNDNPILIEYYANVSSAHLNMNQGLAPYDDTINQADEAIQNIDVEIDALYERITVLETQKGEYDGVIVDANESRDKIINGYVETLKGLNNTLFEHLHDKVKEPRLLDKTREWDIDLQYMEAFNTIYICEIPKEENMSITPDAGVSDWINDINKPE